MAEEGIDGDICRDMLKYLENGENASIRVGEREGVPIYFSVVDLGINDWHYVVCFQADMANSHMERIVYPYHVRNCGSSGGSSRLLRFPLFTFPENGKAYRCGGTAVFAAGAVFRYGAV